MNRDKQLKVVAAVFFASGAAAILYQLAWQRLLFSIYGTNSSAISAIVAAFMGGLGIGSLVGGVISKRKLPLLAVFAVVELLSGIFGLVSVPLLRFVGDATAGVDIWVGAVVSFCLVLIPTALMGATLPLLTAFFVGHENDMGESIGELYQTNTLGSAVACVLATLLVFPYLGLTGSVWVAVALNFIVAIVSYVAFKGATA